MSDQLARTGAAGGALVIGATVITGWWVLSIAVGVILMGAFCVRVGFRRGRTASQR